MSRETRSEKILKDTLHRLKMQRRVLYWQKVTTPMYQPESIDFLVIDLHGRTHLIEVKESGTGVISQGRFNEHQQTLLGQGRLNSEESGTRVWIVAMFYDGSRYRNSNAYYEQYFWLPGKLSRRKTISLGFCLTAPDVCLLAEYRGREWITGIHKDGGLSTRNNPTEGFITLPFLEKTQKENQNEPL